MNYLIGNLVAEAFPETARIFYGLSKSEFVTEPELELLALTNGLFAAAVALGHTDRVLDILSNPRINSKDVHAAFEIAYTHKQFDIIKLLVDDTRLNLAKGSIGKAPPDLAQILLACPKIVPTKKDIIYAALGPHGGFKDVYGDVHSSDLTTLRLLLACEKVSLSLSLTPSFCQKICQCVENILMNDPWEYEGIPGEITPHFFPKGYVCYTNFWELAHILKTDARFAEWTEWM